MIRRTVLKGLGVGVAAFAIPYSAKALNFFGYSSQEDLKTKARNFAKLFQQAGNEGFGDNFYGWRTYVRGGSTGKSAIFQVEGSIYQVNLSKNNPVAQRGIPEHLKMVDMNDFYFDITRYTPDFSKPEGSYYTSMLAMHDDGLQGSIYDGNFESFESLDVIGGKRTRTMWKKMIADYTSGSIGLENKEFFNKQYSQTLDILTNHLLSLKS